MRRTGFAAVAALVAGCGEAAVAPAPLRATTAYEAPGTTVAAVWGTGDDAWAVGARDGRGVVLRWDGRAFQTAREGEDPPLHGVWGLARDDVWAVGQGVILRWNGAAWTRAWSSDRPLVLRAVWGASRNDVWASGVMLDHLGRPESWRVLHWRGRGWRDATFAGPFLGARWYFGDGPDDGWALVGAGVFRWDGARWAYLGWHPEWCGGEGLEPGPRALLDATPGLWQGPDGARWTVERGAREVARTDATGARTVVLREADEGARWTNARIWGAAPDDVWVAVTVDGGACAEHEAAPCAPTSPRLWRWDGRTVAEVALPGARGAVHGLWGAAGAVWLGDGARVLRVPRP